MKRLLLALVFVLAASLPSQAAFALIANVQGHSTDNNGFTTSSINTSGADLLVAVVSDAADGSTLSDSKSNTWTKLTPHTFGTNCVIYYAKNATVGSGHTFTLGGTATTPTLSVSAWSGSDTSAPFDQQNGAVAAGATSLQTGSVTPTTGNQLIIAGLTGDANVTRAIDSGFTILDQVGHSGFGFSAAAHAYLIQGTAAAVNPTWSWTGSENTEAAIATFKAAAGGAPACRPTLSTLGVSQCGD